MEVFDRDNDGKYSFPELKLLLEAYKIPDANGLHQTIWNKLDPKGKGHLTKDEVMALMQQFCFSQEPNDPGNFVFGPF
jgi:Ca2+-binding EF-hand superfamily protein